MSLTWTSLLSFHVILLIYQLFVLVAVIHIITKQRRSSTIFAWMLGFLFIPYIAIPLYFIIGIRKRRNVENYKPKLNLKNWHQQTEQYSSRLTAALDGLGVPPITTNNALELYTNGVDAYHALYEQIIQAQSTIFMSTYVFQDDQMTRQLVEQLIKKAQQGVQVKLLIDSLGSHHTYFARSIWKPLIAAGGDVQFFMPIFQNPFRNYINLRNHRKIYLFDGKTLLTGGMNIGNEYLGPEPDSTRWDDLLFKITGDSIYYFYDIFANDWYFATKEKLPKDEILDVQQTSSTALQVVASGPDIPVDGLFDGLMTAIYQAKERIWIVTPYFVPSEDLFNALRLAYCRGVSLRLLTPRISNHRLADWARSDFMRRLSDQGVAIDFLETMTHAKALLIDNSVAVLGSVNMDNRSLFLNYEVATLAYSADVIDQIDQWMQSLLSNAHQSYIEKPNRRRLAAENITKFLLPLL